MSIAVVVRVSDGLVLGSDSALTLLQKSSGGSQEARAVYNNANKIVNLHKNLPIGCITHGIGSIGPKSIPAILKDFRKTITEEGPALNAGEYCVADVAGSLAQYLSAEAESVKSSTDRLAMLVCGYSAKPSSPEILKLERDKDGRIKFVPVPDQSAMVIWGGVGESLHRIFFGLSPTAESIISQVVKDRNQCSKLLTLIRQRCSTGFVQPQMPIQDAIDLTRFLVDLSINFQRFAGGAPIVGGPIEIAAITKHEGFKWISRKHYYRKGLNRHGSSRH